jgi:pimeloyl-ACP methyl ester carboxylesterase
MSFTASRSSLKLTGGTNMSYVTIGDKRRAAVVLIHGQPSSANSFRDLWSALADMAFVVAPDLPGHGRSDVLQTTTFDNFAIAVTETGLGPQWNRTIEYWSHPNAENEAAATAHLSLEGVRSTYLRGLPDDVARRISPTVWEEDWRVMSQPGRLDAQRALLADYGRYAARFGEISAYLRTHRPPALMVRGRHDPFFELAETLSWMEDLPRMEVHILDGGHFLLETHAEPAGKLMRDFIARAGSTISILLISHA